MTALFEQFHFSKRSLLYILQAKDLLRKFSGNEMSAQISYSNVNGINIKIYAGVTFSFTLLVRSFLLLFSFFLLCLSYAEHVIGGDREKTRTREN